MSRDTPTTIWEHIDELAGRLKIVLYTIVISTIAMLVFPGNLDFFANPLESYVPLVTVILRLMREQVLPAEVTLIGFELGAPIELYVLAAFVFGIAITMPVLAFQIYRFVDPALNPDEKGAMYPFIGSVSVLFVVGLLFGYLVLTPYMIRAMFPFFSAVGAEMVISIKDFYSTLIVTALMTGVIFTFPVFLVLIVKYGIVGTDVFTKNRKYLYAGLLFITMLVTPDGGFVGNFILFIPIVLLFEVGVLVAKRFEKRDEMESVPSLSKGINCRFCGSTIPKDAIFCPKCERSQK
ncbi:MAG: twin-arginine translocase subunit TatC [Candidatus Hodarchaeota archaeon]